MLIVVRFCWLIALGLYPTIAFSSSPLSAPLDLNSELELSTERSYVAPREVLNTLGRVLAENSQLLPSQQALILENASRAKWHAKDYAGALREAQMLEALGKREDDKTFECLGVLQQVYSYWKMGKIETAYELSRRATRFLASEISASAKVKTLLTTAQVESEEHRVQSAQLAVAKAMHIALTSEDEALVFLTIKAQAGLAIAANDIPLALDAVDRLLELGWKSPYRERLVRAKDTEQLVASAAGMTARAKQAMDDNIQLMRTLGLGDALGRTLVTYSDLELKSNRNSEAIALSEEALRLEAVGADDELATRAQVNHATALIRSGNVAEGKKEVVMLLTSSHNRPSLLANLPQIIVALTHVGDADAAVQLSAKHNQIATEEAIRRAKKEETALQEIDALAREGRLRTLEAVTERNHRNVWLALTLTVAAGLLGTIFFHVRLRSSSRRLEENNRQLYAISNFDYLTGLSNRRSLENFVSSNTFRSDKPMDGRGFALLMDVDHFKQLNDKFGHAVGDQVLKTIAQRLLTVFSADDMLARWGGEEFLAVLPTRHVTDAAEIALKVLVAVAGSPIKVNDSAFDVTISAGICPLKLEFSDRSANWSDVLVLADEALYFAKQNGRNKAYGISTAVEATSVEMRRGLRTNVEEGKVTLFEASYASTVPDRTYF